MHICVHTGNTIDAHLCTHIHMLCLAQRHTHTRTHLHTSLARGSVPSYNLNTSSDVIEPFPLCAVKPSPSTCNMCLCFDEKRWRRPTKTRRIYIYSCTHTAEVRREILSKTPAMTEELTAVPVSEVFSATLLSATH